MVAGSGQIGPPRRESTLRLLAQQSCCVRVRTWMRESAATGKPWRPVNSVTPRDVMPGMARVDLALVVGVITWRVPGLVGVIWEMWYLGGAGALRQARQAAAAADGM